MTKQIQITAHDEVIVTELRPMSDAPMDGGYILIEFQSVISMRTKPSGKLIPAFYQKDMEAWNCGGELFNGKYFAGFMHLPTYKPK